MKNLLLLFGCLLMASCGLRSKTVIYPAPAEERKSDDFEMLVGGKPVFVYQARVSRLPVNQIWPGYQRPVSQTEIASFAYFDMKGEQEIVIRSAKAINSVTIRPKEYNLVPEVEGNTIRLKIKQPAQFVVEVNDYHHALHIFANPMESSKIDSTNTKVHYFGPGVHEAGLITLNSDETVYIAGGAVVYGVIVSENTHHVSILGRGILDASKIARGGAPNMISLKKVKNAVVDGIILRDPHEWTIVPNQCDSVEINSVKLIGLWRYNSDGIDVVNSRNVFIRNSFIRAFDDNIALKGLKGAYDLQHSIMENIHIDNCVLWNDWGRPIELGLETVVDTMRNISFTHCFIPHFTWIAIDIQNGDRGYVRDVRFEDISIEDPILDSITIGTTPMNKAELAKTVELIIKGFDWWTTDTLRGNIRDIKINNIRYNSLNPTFINLVGHDSTHLVDHILIRDYFINGKKITDERFIRKNEFVRNVKLD